MTIGQLITEGVGSYGNIKTILTDGLEINLVIPTAIATIITEAFGAHSADSAFIVTEGFMSGTPVIVSNNPVRRSPGRRVVR